MGGFQAFSEGVGATGEQLAGGMQNALNEALKVRAQLHGEQMDAAHLALAQAGQQQAYNLAQQQHELTRQQIIQQGWRDLGPTVENGQYSRTFYNDNTKQYSRVPIQGNPPDSPGAAMNYYAMLKSIVDDKNHPAFTDDQAKRIAFRMPNLYREGPVGMMEGFRDLGRDLASSGTTKIKGGLGQDIDLSTPEGIQAFAQDQQDLVYGRGGYFRSLWGSSAAGRDMTGFTTGEAREYKAAEDGLNSYAQMLEKAAGLQMQSILGLDPSKVKDINDNLIQQFIMLQGMKDDKYNEILGRRNPQAIDKSKPLMGKLLSKSQWAKGNPGKDVDAAMKQFTQQGALIVP